jgi:hypothetical protein
VIPDSIFVLVVTCAYHCGSYNLQRDPTPYATATAVFATEAECNENVPRFYGLLAKGLQSVYPDGKPAESIEVAEKRAYADYRITCGKVPTGSLKGLK